MPSYRLSGLLMAYLKDDRLPEDIKKIDDMFEETDVTGHPFHGKEFEAVVRGMCSVLSMSAKGRTDNVIYDPRFVELPIEERKRREAQARGKAYRVPEWWRGEQANYKVAKSMMGVLPKRGKQPVKDS